MRGWDIVFIHACIYFRCVEAETTAEKNAAAFSKACVRVAPAIKLLGDRVNLLGEHLSNPMACPPFAQGIGPTVMEMATESTQMLEALKLMNQNAIWDTQPFGCYDEFVGPLCSLHLVDNYTASNGCQTETLPAVMKILKSCSLGDGNFGNGTVCTGYHDNVVMDADKFCAEARTVDVDEFGHRLTVSIPIPAANPSTDCTAIVQNFNVCQKIAGAKLKYTIDDCLNVSMWPAYCTARLTTVSDSMEDSACLDGVLPAILFLDTFHQTTGDKLSERWCSGLRAEYAARLTKRHADLLNKIQAGYDALRSCSSLLSYCERIYSAPLKEVVTRVRLSANELSKTLTSFGEEVGNYVMRWSFSNDSRKAGYDTNKIYIPAPDAYRWSASMTAIASTYEYFTAHYSMISAENDRFGRPLLDRTLPAATRDLTDYVTLQMESVATDLEAIKKKAIATWKQFPLTVRNGATNEDILSGNGILGGNSTLGSSTQGSSSAVTGGPGSIEDFQKGPQQPFMPPMEALKRITLNDALANPGLAHGIAPAEIQVPLNSLQDIINRLQNAFVHACGICQKYEDHYCRADDTTLKSAMAFVGAAKLVAAQIELV